MVQHASAQPAGKPRPPTEATDAFQGAMTQLQLDMNVPYGQSADPDFAALVAAQSKALAAIAAIELKHGADPKMRALAERVKQRAEADLAAIKVWQGEHKER